MQVAVRNATLRIENSLHARADLQRAVHDGLSGLSAPQVRAVIAHFEHSAPATVDRQSLLAALGTCAAHLPAPSSNATLAYLNAHSRSDALGANVQPAAATIAMINRFMNSPLPGEGPDSLANALKADSALARFDDTQRLALANALYQNFTEAPAEIVHDFLVSGGQLGPNAKTLAKIEHTLALDLHPVVVPGQLRNALAADPWIAHKCAESGKKIANLVDGVMNLKAGDSIDALVRGFFTAPTAEVLAS